jgi:acetyltransferase-like isoleucine patch superfamily enzyme
MNSYEIIQKIVNKYFLIYNVFKFKLFQIQIGSGMNVKRSIFINSGRNSKIKIGDNFTFYSGGNLNPLCRNIIGCLCVNDNAVITIGDNVGISSACIWCHKSISIGNNVTIGGDVIIIDSDCHSLDYRHRGHPEDLIHKVDRPIVIEDDVLIGTRSIILKGVTIGARSVIGSGSVVTKNIPSDCIAAGNPCKVIKKNNITK